MNEISMTKKEFTELMDKNLIDVRPKNECFYKNLKYTIKTLDVDNKVILTIKDEDC